MKAEHRHELQTNDLADWLGKKIVAIRPYSKALVGGLIIAVVAIIAFRLLLVQKSGRLGQGWQEFYTTSVEVGEEKADKLDALADTHQGTTLGLWARQAAADAFLSQGVGLLQTDENDAADNLKKALDAYQEVADSADDDLLQPRALLGLAQCHEARNEVNEAMEQYDLVIKGWPDSALAEEARSRRNFADGASTREFLAWFDDQEPRIPAIGDPSSGGLPGGFDFGAPSGSGGTSTDASLPFDTLQEPGESTSGQGESSDQTGTSDTFLELAQPKTEGDSSNATGDGEDSSLSTSDLEPGSASDAESSEDAGSDGASDETPEEGSP